MKKQFTFDLQRFAELSLTQADGYYQIDSKADLQTLADYVNDGGDTSGLKFKLTANISDVDFHIGTADNMFKGTFEGDGKKNHRQLQLNDRKLRAVQLHRRRDD